MGYISSQRIGDNVVVWERDEFGNRIINYYDSEYYFYIEDPNGKYKSIFGKPLSKLTFENFDDFRTAERDFKNKDIRIYESDIPTEIKALSKKYYGKHDNNLHVSFYDIEVDYDPSVGHPSAQNPYAPINAISIYHQHTKKSIVYAVPPKGWTDTLDRSLLELADIIILRTERELLMAVLDEFEDSDVICGWNSSKFDDPYLARRIESELGKRMFKRLSFNGGTKPKYREFKDKFGQTNLTIDLSGRINMDYLELFRKFESKERPSYKLESISEEIIVDPKTKVPLLPKLEYSGHLYELYSKDFNRFLRYNIRDTEILIGLEERLGYVNLAINVFQMSTCLYRHVIGTIRSADYTITSFCHHEKNLIVPNWDSENEKYGDTIQGADVLETRPGFYGWLASVDITSLYPNTIRTLNISPETLVGQFLEEHTAWEEIKKGSEQILTLQFVDKRIIKKTAKQWKDIFKENKCAVSGYGTVFSQNKKGIIPEVITEWFDQRVKYKDLKKAAAKSGNKEKEKYYDKMQYVYKIRMNSLYGALLNRFFRFFDPRMGKSVTYTGQIILNHQCSKIGEILDGDYSKTAKSLVAGDSVAGDSEIILENNQRVDIADIFLKITYILNNKEYYIPENNLKVLTYDEKHNKSCYREIKYVMRHKINKKMYRVWINNFSYIDVTEDHSLVGYINSRNRRKKNNSILKELKPEESKGSSLIYLKNVPRNASSIISKKFPKELYELFGMFIGDGPLNCKFGKNKSKCINISSGLDTQEIIQKIINQLIQLNYIDRYKIRSNNYDIQLYGKIFDLIYDEFVNSEGKKIPYWIFNETEENISHFLRGYFSADGTVIRENSSIIRLTSVKENLLKDVQNLLFLLKISSTIFTETNPNSYDGICSNTFSKHLHIKNNNDFKNVVGFILDRKLKKILKQRDNFYDFSLTKVYKIEELNNFDDYVYDIEVEDTHTFFANNILVHNTDSTYFELKNLTTKEEVIKMADNIGDMVNASFREFLQENFLANCNFDNYVESNRENVSDRSVFVKKKHYAMHIINSEGKDVDELKIMGLSLIKTTTPILVKQFGKKLLERLLRDGEDFKYIDQTVIEFRDELIKKVLETKNETILDIGLPGGVKKIAEYTFAFKNNPNTRLPGRVAACIHYNLCLEEFNDKNNPAIFSGMKVKVFYLKTPVIRNGRKFTSIALPTDTEIVPEWFFTFDIEKDKQVERVLDFNLKPIYNVAGKQVPTHQSVFLDEMWVY